MSITCINSPSNREDKRHIVITIDHLIWVEMCTRQSTGQSFEWYEYVLSEQHKGNIIYLL